MKKKKRLLWDFRLYSTTYAKRGVGTYCTALCKQLFPLLEDFDIYIWGNVNNAPEFLRNAPVHWIPYDSTSWKKDLFRIPLLIYRFKISIFHYWIHLGPLDKCGTGLFHPCRTIATVYDLGVELWDLPHSNMIRKRKFWTIQKILSKSINTICAISSHTKNDYIKLFSRKETSIQIIYMPHDQPHFYKRNLVSPYFLFLRGSEHKNEKNIVAAFLKFHEKHPSYSLILLGENASAHDTSFYTKEKNIITEPSMDYYHDYLCHATALLFCSFQEGFGIPPIEGMAEGCPLIVSDIPPLRETCEDSALFVDPNNICQIEEAMIASIENNTSWSKRSFSAGKRYRSNSSESAPHLLQCYKMLT
ncbi:MAG: glycosyltransferase [Chitinispirillaceae bacterium]|nr:glycosyltransferase [Chitinispirillaceae bacterium]